MLTVEEEAKLRGESPIEVFWDPPLRWLRWAGSRPSSTTTPSSGLGSHNQLPIRQCLRHRHRGLAGSETEMRRFFGHEIEVTLSCLTLGGWDEVLHHCPSRDFRCSLMRGSVLGRNLKDRLVFGRKSGRM